jgi:hypothetical protein
MKAQPLRFDGDSSYEPCEQSEATHVMMQLPGPVGYFQLPVILKGTRAGTGCWSWNGDTEKPTVKPSLLTTGSRFVSAEPGCGKSEKFRCHCWINNGEAQFLSDCTHEFRGQTLGLLDVD